MLEEELLDGLLLMLPEDMPLVPALVPDCPELDVPDMPVVALDPLGAIPRSARSLLHAASAKMAPPAIRAVAKPVTAFFMDLPPSRWTCPYRSAGSGIAGR